MIHVLLFEDFKQQHVVISVHIMFSLQCITDLNFNKPDIASTSCREVNAQCEREKD